MAKLCGGLHKPDAQTVLLPRDAPGFLAPLPVRVLPGVGHKLEAAMKALKIHTVRDLRARSAAELAAGLGVPRARAERLLALGWGRDDEAVVPTGPPKSASVEDSFKSCNSWGAVERVLRVLYPDLLVRVAEVYDEHGILPQRLALKWRFRRTSEGARAKGNGRVSTSTDCPRCLLEATRAGGAADRDRTVAELVAVALGALRRELRSPFDLSLINVAATSFALAPQQPLAFAAAARGALGGASSRQDHRSAAHARRDYSAAASRLGDGPVLSKLEERRAAEGRGAEAREAANAYDFDDGYHDPSSEDEDAGPAEDAAEPAAFTTPPKRTAFGAPPASLAEVDGGVLSQLPADIQREVRRELQARPRGGAGRPPGRKRAKTKGGGGGGRPGTERSIASYFGNNNPAKKT